MLTCLPIKSYFFAKSQGQKVTLIAIHSISHMLTTFANPNHLLTQRNLRAADEVVVNTIHRKKIPLLSIPDLLHLLFALLLINLLPFKRFSVENCYFYFARRAYFPVGMSGEVGQTVNTS